MFGVTAGDQGTPVTAPATPEAAQWEGWGTALKPAFEPIVVARKPLISNVAENVLEHGTGGINVDACRIEAAQGDYDHPGNDLGCRDDETDWRIQKRQVPPSALGRWPANVVLSEEAAAELDAQSGVLKSGDNAVRTQEGTFLEHGGLGKAGDVQTTYGDSGGASRFFYCAKTSKAERWAGVDRCTCETFTEWVNEDREANTPAASDTPPPRAITEHTSGADTDSSTTGSGNKPTDQLPTDSKSTTETRTSRTTGSRTSNSSLPSSTSESTPSTTVAQQTDPGNATAPSATNGSPPTASTSTSTNEVGSSTDDAALATSESSSNRSSAEGLICPSCGGIRGGHPTVKPLALMRWLCRLVTPPGGLILDPFLGSGTTGCAAVLEGFEFIGIEREAEYVAIANARIEFWSKHVGREVEEVLGLHTKSRRAADAHAERGQITLEEALEPAA